MPVSFNTIPSGKLYESYPDFKENDIELKQDGLSEKIKVLLDQK